MARRSTLQLTIANGTTIAWREIGEGPPLVLLHGLGDSHRAWLSVAELLATRFRVLIPDLPGHGSSARPDAPYTLAWYANTIASWMDALGIERAHFCGHSYGGGVAQWMLLEHRKRVERLALVAPGGFGREVGVALRLGAIRLSALFLVPCIMKLATRLLMPRASRSFAVRGAKEIARLARSHAAPNTGLAFRRTLCACVGTIRGQRILTWQRIHELEPLPSMCVFWGERDLIIPVSHAHEAARRLSNLDLHIYPEAGHFVHLEHPFRFARDLASFLERPLAGKVGRAATGMAAVRSLAETSRAAHDEARPLPSAISGAHAANDGAAITTRPDTGTEQVPPAQQPPYRQPLPSYAG
jgi:pimeloyl-ACP methyl ester carboxylesterase